MFSFIKVLRCLRNFMKNSNYSFSIFNFCLHVQKSFSANPEHISCLIYICWFSRTERILCESHLLVSTMVCYWATLPSSLHRIINSLSLSAYEKCSVPFIIFEPFAGLSPVALVLDTGVTSKVLSRGEDHLPSPAGNTLHNAAQVAVGFLPWGCLASSCSTCFPPGHPGPFFQSCFPAFQSPACTGIWSCFYPGAELAIYFLALHEVPLCPFLWIVQLPLNGSIPIWLNSRFQWKEAGTYNNQVLFPALNIFFLNSYRGKLDISLD